MKKLYLLLLMIVFSISKNDSFAQCTVKDIIIKVNSTTTVNGSCLLNIDFTFTIQNNGGNKYIYIHSWLQNEYPNPFGCPNMSGNLKAPKAADLALSRINLGIHNDIHAGHPQPTLLTSYPPDANVTFNQATQLIRQVYPTGDSARFTIKGVLVNIPLACGQVVFMTADFWSTQAQNSSVVHCVSCNNQYIIDPRVFGSVNCGSPRTYNVIIRSSAPQVLSGHYKIYLDNPIEGNIIGSFGPEDTLVDEHDYQTSLGVFNQYLATNMSYEPYSNQSPNADRNLWALVETNNYANKVLGYLVNTCAPLPLGLRYFNIHYQNKKTELQWMVEDHADIRDIEVQRQIDKQPFVAIASLAVKNNTQADASLRYFHTDPAPLTGSKIYYRLCFIAHSGEKTYSDIKMIQLAPDAEVVVYPNPARGNIFVSVPVSTGPVDIMFTDLSGKNLAQWNGVNQRTLDIDSFKPGVYLMRIKTQNGDKEMTRKIIIY